MKQRWLVAVVGIPLLLLVLLVLPAWATLILVCGIAGVAAWELLHTAGKQVGLRIYIFTIAIAAAQLCIVYDHRRYSPIMSGESGIAAAAELWMLPMFLVVYLFSEAIFSFGTEHAFPFADVATAIVAGAVFPMMYSCILLLRMDEVFGRIYVLAPFVIAFAGDSLSMYFGMLFGKRKMAPRVSPNKTWAGGIGGPLGSALGMLLLGFVGSKTLGYPANYPLLMLLGIVANVFGQIGDLSMSLVKREANIKDYSHLFLTHGGMLDRFDSTLFIAPIVFFFVSYGAV